jgi:hypothetical protein
MSDFLDAISLGTYNDHIVTVANSLHTTFYKVPKDLKSQWILFHETDMIYNVSFYHLSHAHSL